MLSYLTLVQLTLLLLLFVCFLVCSFVFLFFFCFPSLRSSFDVNQAEPGVCLFIIFTFISVEKKPKDASKYSNKISVIKMNSQGPFHM